MPKDQPALPVDLVQLARIALAGRPQDVHLLIHKLSKKYRQDLPDMSDALVGLLQESPSRATPFRKQADVPLPVDIDSRLQLLRVESTELDHHPVLAPPIHSRMQQVVSERAAADSLRKAGLQPTKTVLFTGPPGVGKTMAAKWIARQLNRPLLVLDLTAVMSSYLGKTGNNLRYVLDYAKSINCVLLMDELDAIAKRRDDTGEIGELKRLVTVLLQEIDDWPSSGLLVAATNHPGLLDPAVWRRFEMILDFPLPDPAQIEYFVHMMLHSYTRDSKVWATILSVLCQGRSFNDLEKTILLARRTSIISGTSLENQLKHLLDTDIPLPHEERIQLANLLVESNVASQRRAEELTGVSRNTIRKRAAGNHVKNK